MSRRRSQITVEGWDLVLCPRNGDGYWVRLRRSGRTMGVIVKTRSKWNWETWPGAFRGDGRRDTRCDGDPTDVVAAELLASGRMNTQVDACSCLIDHLRTNEAPVLGYGPHPLVTPAEVASSVR